MPSAPRLLAAAVLALAAAGAAGAAASTLAACDAPAPPPAAVTPGHTVDPATPWSRADLGPRAATDPKSSAPRTTAAVSPEALADLLRAVPSSAPGPTGPDGGTLVGTDTGAPATASPVTVEEPPRPAAKAAVQLGIIAIQADMASPAIEREARAQLYYPLVTRCRDTAGKLLPPDAVRLEFTIDPDGYIVPQNVSATAADPAHRQAAECMRRELAGLAFRGPPGARGNSAQVKMTVPSVD